MAEEISNGATTVTTAVPVVPTVTAPAPVVSVPAAPVAEPVVAPVAAPVVPVATVAEPVAPVVPVAPVPVAAPPVRDAHYIAPGAFQLVTPGGRVLTSPNEVWNTLDEAGRQTAFTVFVAMLSHGTVLRDHTWSQMQVIGNMLRNPDSPEHRDMITKLEEFYGTMKRSGAAP